MAVIVSNSLKSAELPQKNLVEVDFGCNNHFRTVNSFCRFAWSRMQRGIKTFEWQEIVSLASIRLAGTPSHFPIGFFRFVNFWSFLLSSGGLFAVSRQGRVVSFPECSSTSFVYIEPCRCLPVILFRPRAAYDNRASLQTLFLSSSKCFVLLSISIPASL